MNLQPLQRAIDSLRDILAQPVTPYVRDGAIQRFEYTFELSWKTLQRRLKQDGLDVGSPKQVFRAGQQAGYVKDVESWFAFLKLRNLTVHTYNEDVADEVYAAAIAFLPFAQALLEELRQP